MKSRLKISTILLVLSFFNIPFFTHAQIPSSIDGIQITAIPELPSPGQQVNIQLESYITDLSAASITWSVDGKVFTKGVGVKSVEVPAPALGKNMTVVAAVTTVEGREVRKASTIKSGGVDLVWESSGFVPPLYKGKALFAYQNTIKIIAIPHLAGTNGAELDPKTLVYKWTENDKVIQDQSGYGKQMLKLQTDIPRPLTIQLEVGAANGTSKATASLTLTPGDPSISFYEEDPLYGVLYNKELVSSVRLANQEISIRAVPYTFSFSKSSPLSYQWNVNHLARNDLSTNESITLRTKGDTEGSSLISLELRNKDNILQGARNSLNVIFSKKAAEETASPFK